MYTPRLVLRLHSPEEDAVTVRPIIPTIVIATGIVAGITTPGAAASPATPSNIRGGGIPERQVLWESVFGPGATPSSLAVGPDGTRIYLTGDTCFGCLDDDYSTVAYDGTTGQTLWVARYDGPAHNVDSSYSVAASPDGATVFVTGSSMDSDYVTDFATVAYDAATGHELWSARYAGPDGRFDIATSIGVDPSGTIVVVTGKSMGPAGFDYATVAYDGATGAQMWVARYEGPGVDIPHGLVVSPDGRTVYVTGESVGWIYSDYATIAYDAISGVQRWVARYNSGGTRGDTAFALGVSPDSSRVYVTGCSGDIDVCVNSDWVTIAYDASGQQIWRKAFDSPAHEAAFPTALEVSPDGSLVYVAGTSVVHAGFDYAVVAYDSATGQPAWRGTYDGGGDDVAAALAVAPNGSEVVVTGYMAIGGRGGTATVAFDGSTGHRLWRDIHEGPSAVATEFSNDSATVFVTGGLNYGTAFDTIAYRA
jgi:hypothetical protein